MENDSRASQDLQESMTPSPDVRLVAAAVALGEFTVEGLAAASDCKVNTARSWLTRWKPWLDGKQVAAAGRGRPALAYSLTDDGVARARGQIESLHRQVADHVGSAAESRMLDEADAHLKLWKVSTAGLKGGESEAAGRAEMEALRLHLLDCWRGLARRDVLGSAVEDRHLLHLAHIEAEAGIVVPNPGLQLVELSRWLAGRLRRIRNGDATLSFAARVMRARIETRPASALATAAALVAPVVSDEGHDTEQLVEEDWSRAIVIAEVIPISDRLTRVESALSGAEGSYCEDDGDAQAVLRGLTACRDAGSELSVRDWLAGAIQRSEWRDVLAPVVVHGLLEADGAQLDMCAPYRDRLESGLASYAGNAGLLRSTAIRMAERYLRYSRPADKRPLPGDVGPSGACHHGVGNPRAEWTKPGHGRAVIKPDSNFVSETFGSQTIQIVVKA